MTAPSLAYQDAMNGIAILYDALSDAENELDKFKTHGLSITNVCHQKMIILSCIVQSMSHQ